MKKLSSNSENIFATVLSLIAVAVLLRLFGKYNTLTVAFGILRSAIYIGLFFAWGVSIQRRIIQKNVRCYLTIISVLMVLWLFLRTVKYFFVTDTGVIRQLWYAYYIPMLLIPMFSVLTAVSLGKPENYKLPLWLKLFSIPTVMFILLVLTNDMHQLVFSFNRSMSQWNDMEYTYMPGFAALIGWMIICGVFALTVIVIKSRVPQTNKVLWLPFLPLILAAIYSAMYLLHIQFVTLITDMTVFDCLMIASVYESCIFCGIIRSNLHYAEFLKIFSTPVMLADNNYETHYASMSYIPISKKIMKMAAKKPVELNNSVIINSMPVTGGYIFWQVDLTQELSLREKLKTTKEKLSEEKDLLEAEILLKGKQAITRTRNKLYDSVISEIPDKFVMIENITDSLNDDEKANCLRFRKLCIIGAYVKRRCNLLILNEEHNRISSAELFFCLNESVEYIRFYGIECTLFSRGDAEIYLDFVKLAYDVFEEMVENLLPSLSAMLISYYAGNNALRLSIQADCADNEYRITNERIINEFERLAADFTIDYENGTLYISLLIEKGDENVCA